MRCLVMTSVCLVFSTCFARGASVEVIGIQPSAQKARITVLLDGKPQKDVKLTVTTTDGQSRVSLVTDSHGTVRLPILAPGNYCVLALVAPPIRRSEICLAISRRHVKSKFSLILVPANPPPLTFEEKLKTAETAPAEKVRQFAGVVQDALGAVIARAEIEVMPRGSRDLARARKTATDEVGRFAFTLEPGSYTVILKTSGFETKILAVDVDPNALKDNVVVRMEVGAITE